jgi:signal transduction histidine kinase
MRFVHSLSGRLLVLTVAFVMLAEVLIFLPSVARYRADWLEQRLGDAHLALLAVEAHPAGMVDMDLQRRLLDHAGTLAMRAWRPGQEALALTPDHLPPPAAAIDLRADALDLVAEALAAIARRHPRVVSVTGLSPADPAVKVEAILTEAAMIEALRAYGWRIFGLSLLISLITAALVYTALHWLLVRPLHRLTASMTAFREAPEDDRRILRPSSRRDEVGIAEQALAEMQQRLRAALRQQARLAAVGTAVAKISHDLKGVLTTAILESDRLEASAADPEVKEVTRGLARALERAVALTSRTLWFAKEAPPEVQARPVALHPVAAEVAAGAGRGLAVTLDLPEDLMVEADAELLLRILDNLMRNAVEAGATVLRLQAVREGGMVQTRLRDDGPGLPEKARANLFVPFSGSARPGGTGLGLPIARDLARAMGGDLTLEDTGPAGTGLVLALPAAALASLSIHLEDDRL